MLSYSNEILSTVISDTKCKNSKKALKRKKITSHNGRQHNLGFLGTKSENGGPGAEWH